MSSQNSPKNSSKGVGSIVTREVLLEDAVIDNEGTDWFDNGEPWYDDGGMDPPKL